MITYEQDPDVVRWGLQLFESDPYSNYPFCDSTTQDDNTNNNDDNALYYHANAFNINNYAQQEEEEQFGNVEEVEEDLEDEIIARALQQELSQLAVEEEPQEVSQDGNGSLQLQVVSGFDQNWLGHSMGNCGSGQEDVCEEGDDVRHSSSSCSSPQENLYREEDWSYSLELSDENVFGGEVGKWLNEMVPIPHVPRINGEIPSIDEATLDHQRLLDRLQVYDLVEHKVQGDGNCQFRALSDQFYRTPEHHEFVRQQVVNQLKSHPDIYEGYVPMAYGEYLEKMSRSGEWGDHVTLQAAADSYGVKIIVITSFKDTCYIEILPNVQRSIRVILLSFWAEVHYNSIFPPGDVPTYQTKKKKKWRMFRNKQLETPDEYQ